jgi:uncharacterized protein YndB with AHSA1/START domain
MDDQNIKRQFETENELITSRVFDAERENVFKMWEDPHYLAQWWGPKDFKNTFHQFEFKSGGIWSYTMHSPDGTDYENKNIFVEIIDNEIIIFDHVSGHKFRITFAFEDYKGKTKLTWNMKFESTEEFEKVKNFVAEANEQNLDRLEMLLEKLT